MKIERINSLLLPQLWKAADGTRSSGAVGAANAPAGRVPRRLYGGAAAPGQERPENQGEVWHRGRLPIGNVQDGIPE